MFDCVLNMALVLQALFQPLASLKYFTFFKCLLGFRFGKIGKNGEFTLSNKAMFTSYCIGFRFVSQYYVV